MKELEIKAERNRTAKHCVENLIKSVFLMMIFVRAEKEADWPLHLLATAGIMWKLIFSGFSFE